MKNEKLYTSKGHDIIVILSCKWWQGEKEKETLVFCYNVPFALTRLPHDKFQGNFVSSQR